jgi:hypothetical protein
MGGNRKIDILVLNVFKDSQRLVERVGPNEARASAGRKSKYLTAP